MCVAAIGRREAVIDRQAGVYVCVCVCLRGVALQSAQMMSRSGAVLGLLGAAIDR